MEISEHLECLEDEGRRLGDAAARTVLNAPIPHCEGWTARDLLAHVGEVHRWAAAIVGTPRPDPAVERPVVPDDADLVEWYQVGRRGIVETLRTAPIDVQCWFLFRETPPLAGWVRRQALETAVHRVDLELATGRARAISRDLAADGMSELLLGFGARRKVFEPGTIRLAPTDAEAWHVTIGADGLVATQDDPGTPTDVTVSGIASDVYLWMWNRPSDAAVEGDQGVAAEWGRIRVRWS